MYGIPNFKLEKHVVDRRVKLMEAEGINFMTNANVGDNVKVEDLRRDFDAIVLCGGATHARDLNVPGRELKGIYRAMDYLPLQNKRQPRRPRSPTSSSSTPRASTSSSSAAATPAPTASAPPSGRGPRASSSSSCSPARPRPHAEDVAAGKLQPWPYWPMIFRTSSAHEEAAVALRRRRPRLLHQHQELHAARTAS